MFLSKLFGRFIQVLENQKSPQDLLSSLRLYSGSCSCDNPKCLNPKCPNRPISPCPPCPPVPCGCPTPASQCCTVDPPICCPRPPPSPACCPGQDYLQSECELTTPPCPPKKPPCPHKKPPCPPKKPPCPPKKPPCGSPKRSPCPSPPKKPPCPPSPCCPPKKPPCPPKEPPCSRSPPPCPPKKPSCSSKEPPCPKKSARPKCPPKGHLSPCTSCKTLSPCKMEMKPRIAPPFSRIKRTTSSKLKPSLKPSRQCCPKVKPSEEKCKYPKPIYPTGKESKCKPVFVKKSPSWKTTCPPVPAYPRRPQEPICRSTPSHSLRPQTVELKKQYTSNTLRNSHKKPAPPSPRRCKSDRFWPPKLCPGEGQIPRRLSGGIAMYQQVNRRIPNPTTENCRSMSTATTYDSKSSSKRTSRSDKSNSFTQKKYHSDACGLPPCKSKAPKYRNPCCPQSPCNSISQPVCCKPDKDLLCELQCVLREPTDCREQDELDRYYACYQNKEYHMYHDKSYYDLLSYMRNYRQRQPSSKPKKGCY